MLRSGANQFRGQKGARLRIPLGGRDTASGERWQRHRYDDACRFGAQAARRPAFAGAAARSANRSCGRRDPSKTDLIASFRRSVAGRPEPIRCRAEFGHERSLTIRPGKSASETRAVIRRGSPTNVDLPFLDFQSERRSSSCLAASPTYPARSRSRTRALSVPLEQRDGRSIACA